MTSHQLSRRGLFFAAATLLTKSAIAATSHEIRFVWGGFDGAVYHGGLHVIMQPGWKTYWRVPGEGGIPPTIEVSGSNIGGFQFDCPLPHRIRGEEGESVGYKDEVVFPFVLTPANVTAPVVAEISAFIGVCDTVCIPVQLRDQAVLKPVAMATREAMLLAQWRSRVPMLPGAGPVVSVIAGAADDKLHVDFMLARPVSDLFIEGNALHYYGAPQFAADGLSSRAYVHGAKSMADLQGSTLRLTIDDMGQGLEQRVTVG